MSTCVYCRDLHKEIYSPESIAKELRRAASEIEDQMVTKTEIHIAGIDVVIDAENSEVYVMG